VIKGVQAVGQKKLKTTSKHLRPKLIHKHRLLLLLLLYVFKLGYFAYVTY